MMPDDDQDPAYWQALLGSIKLSTTFYSPPGPEFDPLNPQEGDFLKFGLPPMPDPRIEPVRHSFWRKLFSQPEGYPPLRFVQADFSWPILEPFFRHRFNHGGSPIVSGSRHQGSSNWSGGYITPKDGRMFVEVHGVWQVPRPSLPAGADATADCWSSTWIGLDGQRRYLHSSLPQIGTEQRVTATVAGPKIKTKVWWQWWLRDHHFPPVYLPLVVSPGDVIRAQLNVLAPKSPGTPMRVKFFIKNETTGLAITPFDRPAPVATMKTGPSPIQIRISGATAEWVTERPTQFFSDALHRLPDYGSVLFSDCYAAAAVDLLALPVIQRLPGARLIDMVEVRDAPPRTAKISLAKPQGQQSLSTVYR